ncbi:MAG: efflux RND transporter periplasmic adaptor subunit [Luteolibacter sp.]|jgi:RND family efflux transporter MFP subunit
MAIVLRIVPPVLILALGVFAWMRLSVPVEEPQPERREAQLLKTERLELQRTDFPVILDSQGIVRAHFETTLAAQVGGTVVAVHPSFEDGAFFRAGEVLLELDTADYETQLVAAESRLARAEAALAQEEARANQARLNWDDMGYTDEPSPLVLRVPQLKEARANVSAAEADLDQAKRNLERTKVRAPFDGRVKSRLVGLGQAINATTPLGQIFASDKAEVRLPLTPRQLEFVNLPTREGDAAVHVTLSDSLSSQSSGRTWDARIVRTEGSLDENSRELFAIAEIVDPFGLASGLPELRIGQPVRAAIDGVLLHDVFVFPRSALRGIDRVFLIDRDPDRIRRATIQPVWTTSDIVVVRDDLENGDWIATSRLPLVPNGAPVEIVEPASAAETLAEESHTS